MIQNQDDIKPQLLNAIHELNIRALPPWNFIYENFENWTQQFDRASLSEFVPFARMINDDVIACFRNGSSQVFLFNLPLTNNAVYFNSFDNMHAWLKNAMEDMYEYLISY